MGCHSLLQGIFPTQVSNPTINRIRFSGFPHSPVFKNLPCNTGDTGSIPEPARSYVPRGNKACVPRLLSLHTRAHAQQLLSPRAATTEAHMPKSPFSAREAPAMRRPCTVRTKLKPGQALRGRLGLRKAEALGIPTGSVARPIRKNPRRPLPVPDLSQSG